MHKSQGNDGHIISNPSLWVGNGLQGTLPDIFDALPFLEDINISKNNFNSALPPSWTSLSHLKNFYAWDAGFTGSLRNSLQTGDLASLEVLYLADNTFSGNIPSTLAYLQSLKSLFLNNNDFSGSLPDIWDFLTGLTDLQLASNNFTGTLPDSFASLTSLNLLNIANNNFDRDQAYYALIPSALQSWIAQVNTTLTNNQ